MVKGTRVRLMPFKKKVERDGFRHSGIYKDVFIEEVFFIELSPTGNARIIDMHGHMRLCNTEDLVKPGDN